MTEHYIRPDVRAYLDMLAANPRPKFNDQVLAMMRLIPKEQMLAMFEMMEAPVGELGEVRDLIMPGPGGEIELRLFDPRASRGAGPVVVFYHGGGFVAGNIDTHAALAAEIARQLDLPVVSVEYRLAPENKWPAAPDDAEAAARWIAGNGAAFGREFTALVLCGDSAGGNLTAVTALALRDNPAALPMLMQFAIYPKVDATREYASMTEFGSGYALDADDIGYFELAFAPDKSSVRHSPLLADQSGLVPTVVLTASLDPLRDEGRAYAAKLADAGVKVVHLEGEGLIHGFCTYRKAIPSGQADLVAACDAARAMLAQHNQK